METIQQHGRGLTVDGKFYFVKDSCTAEALKERISNTKGKEVISWMENLLRGKMQLEAKYNSILKENQEKELATINTIITNSDISPAE